MAVTSSIQMIGDKAVVGALDVSFLPGVPILPGTFVANGPAYFGAGVPVPTAGVMIGPPINLPVPVSLEVKGVANIFGILNPSHQYHRMFDKCPLLELEILNRMKYLNRFQISYLC